MSVCFLCLGAGTHTLLRVCTCCFAHDSCLAELREHQQEAFANCAICGDVYRHHQEVPIEPGVPWWSTCLGLCYLAVHLGHSVQLWGDCTDRRNQFAPVHCARFVAMLTMPNVSVPDTLLSVVLPWAVLTMREVVTRMHAS